MHAVRQRDEGQVHLHLHHAPPQALLVRGLNGVVAAVARLARLATLFIIEAGILLSVRPFVTVCECIATHADAHLGRLGRTQTHVY